MGFLYAAAAIAIVLMNILYSMKFEGSISGFSPSFLPSHAEMFLGNFNTSTPVIVNETTKSVKSMDDVHNLTTKRPRNSKNSSSPLRDHPHAGARDEYGNWGYVADHQIVRKRLLSMFRQQSGKQDATYDDMLRFLPMNIHETELVCNTPPQKGIEREAWDMMARKVQIGGPAPLPLDPTKHPREPPQGWHTINLSAPIPPFDPNSPPYRNTPHPPKVGCFLYTYKKRHAQVWSVAQTWGWRCDGFLAFSNLTDPGIGAVDLPHVGMESYGNMWQKVRSIWAYIHDNYLDDFDYFHLGGDDTYIVVENLRNYLWSIDDDNGTKPLYIGSHFKTHGIAVCGGGSGYVLNKVTLRTLVRELLRHSHVNIEDWGEDRLIGFTLRPVARCYRTHDARGAQRFWPLDPHILGTYDGTSSKSLQGFYQLHDELPTIKLIFNRSFYKEDLLSSQLITLHILRKPLDHKRVNAIMYRSCPNGTVLADALDKIDNSRTGS